MVIQGLARGRGENLLLAIIPSDDAAAKLLFPAEECAGGGFVCININTSTAEVNTR